MNKPTHKRGRFVKGNPGGPGRPKGSGYVQRCQEIAEKQGGGWDLLEEWLAGKGDASTDTDLRKFALKMILNYGYGKPRQAIELQGNIPSSIPVIIYESITVKEAKKK